MAGTDRVTGLILEIDEALTTVIRRVTGLLLEIDEAQTTVNRRVTGLILEVDINTAVAAIASIAPTSGCIGDNITITGANFEAAQGAGGVTINGTVAIIVSWAAGSIVVTVAAGTTTGSVVVTTNGGQVSNPVPYTVLPEITLINPAAAAVATAVTITGTDFGAVQGAGVVTFTGGVNGVITAWGDTSIVVTVPVGAMTGNVTVTNNSAETSAGYAFTVLAAGGGGLAAMLGVSPVVGGNALLVYPPIRG